MRAAEYRRRVAAIEEKGAADDSLTLVVEDAGDYFDAHTKAPIPRVLIDRWRTCGRDLLCITWDEARL